MIKNTGRTLATTAAMGAALAATVAISGTAHAQDAYAGHWQFKVLATAVMPSGSVVTSSVVDPLGLTANGKVLNGLATTANDNVTPTIAVEYFFMPSISVETIAGITAHHVTGTGTNLPAGGVGVVDHLQIIPFTVTAKYHLVGLLPAGIKPYIGVGPTLFAVINDRPSATVQSLGVTRTKLTSNFGGVIQAGLDVPVGHGYSLALDAKKYFVDTTAHFHTASGADVLDAKVRLNPWVVSAGVAYRF